MLTYQEYEKAVYDWLMAKNSIDPSFTFSTRLNGMKGSELDYFIGTEKSGYFGLTFWSIPISFPGSAADLIDVFFEQKEDGFKFFFEFSQTMSPSDEQNSSALNLLRNIKENVRRIGELTYETTEDLKMFKYVLGSPEPRYTDLEDLFVDLERVFNALIPIVDQGIREEKEINLNFIAQRITPSQFNELREKLEKRFLKYQHVNEFEIDSEVDFGSFIKRFKQEDFENYINFLKEIASRFGLHANDERLVYNVHSRRGHLSFTVGQRYCFVLSNNEKRGKFGFLSKDKLFEQSEQFDGNQPRPWFTYTNEIQLDKIQKENIFEGIEIELNRSPKSGFRKYNKPEFEDYVINKMEKIEVQGKSRTEKRPPLNQILYGPPGTGKTYNTINYAISILEETTIEIVMSEKREDVLSRFNNYKDQGSIEFVTFHQSYGYEDMIEGIKPRTVNGRVVYDVEDGVFKRMCIDSNVLKEGLVFGRGGSFSISSVTSEILRVRRTDGIVDLSWDFVNDFFDAYDEGKLRLDQMTSGAELRNLLKDVTGNRWDPYMYGYESMIRSLIELYASQKEKETCKRKVIIIDEINRGNVSSIFGELITLIEEDKRKDMKEAIQVKLPYSKTYFEVPNNLYILGTMNTADRSVEALDTALRRRFSFVEMLPQPALLKDRGENNSGKVGEIDLDHLLTTINERIEALVDRDHTIGHAFFMEVDSMDSLRNVFANKVIPLLQEYFYGDYAKMEMVIGPDFFNSEKRKKKVTFAIQNEDVEIPTGNYELMNILDPNFNFVSAINRLLNRKISEIEVN